MDLEKCVNENKKKKYDFDPEVKSDDNNSTKPEIFVNFCNYLFVNP
jgi:hypothetical protein